MKLRITFARFLIGWTIRHDDAEGGPEMFAAAAIGNRRTAFALISFKSLVVTAITEVMFWA
jgi:hypothetical protein